MSDNVEHEHIARQPKKMQEVRFFLGNTEVGTCRICVTTTKPRYVDWTQSTEPDFTNSHQDIIYGIAFAKRNVKDAIERQKDVIRYGTEDMRIEYRDL
jgi:hypothetical protein